MARYKFRHAQNIANHLKSLISSTTLAKIDEEDGKDGIVSLKLVLNPISVGIPLIFGDILHNLRGSLDYISSGIVRFHSGKAETRFGFPFFKQRSDFESSQHSLKNADSVAWKIII